MSNKPISIVQPVPLELSDGREVQLILTAGAAMRIKRRLSVDLLGNIKQADALGPNDLCQFIADCCVKWDPYRNPRPGYAYDDQLYQESIHCEFCGGLQKDHPSEHCEEFVCQLSYSIEVSSMRAAINLLGDRGNVGLPRMPLPEGKNQKATADQQETNPSMSPVT